MDSLAPARLALAGLRLWRIPFAVSQTVQVVSKRFFALHCVFASSALNNSVSIRVDSAFVYFGATSRG